MLSWFASYAQRTPTLHRFLSVPLTSLSLPSLHLYSSVVAAKAGDSVLDAMRLMSDEGVSSVAIVDDETGGVLSAVSVTDVGKIVVPAQSNQILGTPLQQLVARIKVGFVWVWLMRMSACVLTVHSTAGTGWIHGWSGQVSRYCIYAHISTHLRLIVCCLPVYSVTPNNTLFYTMQKLLASEWDWVILIPAILIAFLSCSKRAPCVRHRGVTNIELAHLQLHPEQPMRDRLRRRRCVRSPSSTYLSPTHVHTNTNPTPRTPVLSIFARIANIPDVDPRRMQRHRRASSTSSSSAGSRSPRSSGDFARSRSNSRTSLQRRVGSVGSFEGFQPASRWAERVPVPEHE